jgi:hypothetical protein
MSPFLLKQTGGLLDGSLGATILERLDEMSTVNLSAPLPPVRSPAPTEPRITLQVNLTRIPMRW